MSLDLILGFGGLVSFGHAAFSASAPMRSASSASTGSTTLLDRRSRSRSPPPPLFALATGAIVAAHASGVYFIMITLAFGQMAVLRRHLAGRLWRRRRPDSVRAQPPRRARRMLKNDVAFYYVVPRLPRSASTLLCARIVASRFGRVLRGARENAVRMAGDRLRRPIRYQLAAYVIAGTIGGPRRLPARQPGRVRQPRLHAWQRSGELIFMVVLGGLGTLTAPSSARPPSSWLEELLLGLHRALEDDLRAAAGPGRAVCARRADRAALAGGSAAMAEPLLRPAPSSRKRFGAPRVTDDVDLDVAPGELHALIGPNGAGKTTLIHQISGQLAPATPARIVFAGEDVTAPAACPRARGSASRARSRSPRSSRGFTVLENVALAVQARGRLQLPLLRPRRRRAGSTRRALDCARLASASRDRAADAGAACSRTARSAQLELAIALATAAEAAAARRADGRHGPRGIAARRSRSCAPQGPLSPILLVEHDMEAVFALADRVSVLVYGRIIATGAPRARSAPTPRCAPPISARRRA